MNLFYCFLGCFVGTLVGVLPGIGPVGAMAILLPSTFSVPPITGIIMLFGIYYGAMYGGSTTSILVNIPGEAASVVTCLDGYQMARQGRAGPALGISAFGSLIGGTLSVVGLMFLVVPLANIAVKFGPPEYVAVILMGLTFVTYLARGSMLKSLIMVVLGLMLGCVGTDVLTGKFRFTLGIPDLIDGVPLVAMAMGFFGISEVLENLERPGEKQSVIKTKIKDVFPSLEDWKRSIGPILRGSILGFFIGIIPGGGTIMASFFDYTMEKKISKHPEKFGQGAIEGVAGPETANNAGCAGGLIPLMVFGLPMNIIMALLLAILLMHGIYPGPVFIAKHPDIFWGLVASMYIGNGMLLILNLPLIPLWVQLLRVPYYLLFPLILIFCLIGVYSVDSSIFQVNVMIFFGLVGYILRKFEYEFAPLILAFVLGPMLEQVFRQSLIMSRGSLLIFFQRPISAACMILAFILFMTSGLDIVRKTRQRIAKEAMEE
jgi:putative tricarboxylic transport membrane protein